MILPRGAAAVGVAALLVLSGCAGTLFDLTASPATVPEAALTAAGYERGNTTAVPLTTPVGVGPLAGDVTVTSYLSGYSRTTGDDRTATLLVFSTPNAEVGGESVNPLAHLTNRELLARVLAEARRGADLEGVGTLSTVTEVGSTERPVLGTRAEVVTYVATVEDEGEPTALVLHIVAVPHGTDLVVAVGVHGATLDEAATVGRLIEAIEHDSGR